MIEALFDACDTGIVILDRDGRVRAANRAAADLCGHPHDTMTDLTWAELADPEDFPASDLPDSLWSAGRAEAEVRLRHGRGGSFAARARGTVDRAEDCAIIFLETLPALREDARVVRCREIVDRASDAIVTQSLDGIVIDWNPAAEQLYGHPADLALGRPVGLIVPPDRRDELAATLEKAVRGEDLPPFETIRLHRDGRRIDVEVSLFAIADADGRIAGVASIARPVRDPKWVKETLRESQAIRGRLEAMIISTRDTAHRLNNDFTLTVGAIDLLVDAAEFPDSLRPLAGKALAGLEAAIADIRQFQQISRVEPRGKPGEGDEEGEPSVDSRMRRLLVLEDEPSIREAIEAVLVQEGYDVRGAANGLDALALLENFQPDLILLDMRMPVMDGWQFAAAYRQRPGPHAPIIAVSAATTARERAAQIDADGYLAKPFDIPGLLSTVQKAIA